MLWIMVSTIGALLILIVLLYIAMYNSLIYKRNMVKNAFSSIETYLKKRYDLIPNLVSAVKAYMEHESSILTKIVELRSEALQESQPDKKIAYDNEIAGMIRSIMVAVENYPVLKASDSFISLQESLNVTEDQIAASRRAYNAAVLEYNNAVQMFPSNIIAMSMNFTTYKFIKIPEQERSNVHIDNLLKK